MNIAGDNVSVTELGNGTSDSEAVYQVKQSDNGSINYNISYNDIAGNFGINVSGPSSNQEILFDNDIPILSYVHIQSDNDNNSSLAMIGDNITLMFHSNEPIEGPAVLINGATSDQSDNSTQWKVVTQVTSSFASMADVVFEIPFNDYAGNQGSSKTSTTNFSKVLIDRDNPQVTDAFLISSNQNASWARLGDNLTLELRTNEPIRNPLNNIIMWY